MSVSNTASDMDAFVALSAILTGVAQSVLAPTTFDTFNLKEQIYGAAKADNADALAALLARYAELVAQPRTPNDIIGEVMQPKDTPTARMARSIILAWYSGAWYATADLYGTNPPPTPRVLSADAYTQGLMWKVAQAHAMGSAEYPFGYWHTQPAALAQFIGSASA